MHIEMHVILSTLCLALASAVIGNAYYQKKQFYPAIVHITKSNASMAVIYVQFFVIVFMFGKLLRKIFLGTLRAAEFERLLEKFWYALTETCLAFTVFRDDFNPRFVALFTVLLFLKSFHWLAEERIDFMERSPLLGWLFHLRVASLLFVLGLLDYLLLMHAYNSTIEKGPTVQLVFGFEYAILLTILTNSAIKFALHAAEMRTDSPWENKAVFLLYIELVIGLIKVILYVFFVIIMAKIYALPMFVFRPMFFTIRNFKKVLSDVILSRRAIRNMNHLYPEATFEELRTSDNICIICREDMVSNAKKLPCGHIFHTVCLRSWFQRQQTCPTCRLNILRTNNVTPNIQRPVIPLNQTQPRSSEQNLGTEATNVNSISVKKIIYNGTKMSNIPEMNTPFMLTPAFSVNPQCVISPPKIPPSLYTLSDEELRHLEGTERKHVERRIQHLQNIQLMLDASTMLMHQYILLTDHMKSALINTTTKPSDITTENADYETSINLKNQQPKKENLKTEDKNPQEDTM